MMLAMLLRQSIKAILLGYTLCLAAEVAIAAYWIMAAPQPSIPVWAPMLIPAVLAVFVAIRHVRRRMTSISVAGDKLRYESGLFAKSTRTVELMKIQDVRVDQTLGQRIFGVGDISLETAGGSSRIVMTSIDGPQAAADQIMALAQAASK
jgi:membrane protein YdbS with pleckstrin-like domain